MRVSALHNDPAASVEELVRRAAADQQG
ncbi:MAG: hypothetical protein QOH21_787, partial [Acidobacteriota bacterium]|nr:hypothetical protein [Acidobacteriota bacterium]